MGIPIWLDGGWAVDALLGKQTRPHDDLDIVIDRQHLSELCEHLRGKGYSDVPRDDSCPWNFVLGDNQGRQVDIHVISFFDEAGNGIYGPVEEGLAYPAGCLTGKGTIDGCVVNCLTPERLVKFHTGYKLDRNDFLDVRAICEKFDVEMPDEHKAYWRTNSPTGLLIDAQQTFASLLNEARDDPNILAFWLDGSRGKGLETDYSDYDCTMVVEEKVSSQYLCRYRNFGSSEIDLCVMTLSQFPDFAAWGSDTAWARYNFTQLSVLVDKTGGEVQRLINEKGTIPAELKTSFIAGALDHFINQTYRSLKCFRDGTPVGARLEAAEAVTPFLNAVFALHDRLRPYYKYLEWELNARPLTRFTLTTDKIIQYVLDIAVNGDAPAQQKLLSHFEKLARADGYGGIFADWGVKLEWMKTVRF